MRKRDVPKRMPPEGVAEFERIYTERAIAHARAGIQLLTKATDMDNLWPDKAAECFSEAARFAGMVDLLGEVKWHMEFEDDEED